MTETLYGTAGPAGAAGNMLEHHRSQYHALALGEVATGFDLTVGAGTREVRVAAGEVAVGGLYGVSDAQKVLAADSQGGTTQRIDTVVWESLLSQGAAGGSLKIVKGTSGASPVAPTLTRSWLGTPGKWQTALWDLYVAGGTVQFAAANFTDRRPGRRRALVFDRNVGSVAVGAGGTVKDVASYTVADPGWTYRLVISANVDIGPSSITAGRITIRARVDGAEISAARSAKQCDGAAVIAAATTQTRTGPATVKLTIEANEQVSGGPAVTIPETSEFVIWQIPA